MNTGRALWKLGAIAINLLFSLGARAQNDPDPIQKFIMGLQGEWKVEGANLMEEWKMQGDTLIGRTISWEEADTSIVEDLQIVNNDGVWEYIATVFDQNKGKPVVFKLKEGISKKALFINPEHDFPQQIEYEFVSNARLRVIIRGVIKGEWSESELFLDKQK